MEKENIWNNITRKIAGEGSPEDHKKVEEWIEKTPSNKKTYHILTQFWNFKSGNSNPLSYLFSSIQRRIAVFRNQPPKPFYNTTFFRVAAIIVLIMLSNFMVYLISGKLQTEKVSAWQEIVVPRGNRMKMILPDSTVVWLNNETKLRYASDFRENRSVELIGEAYFNVTHDPAHPFLVNIGKQQIKVLGTKFSVNAYPEENIIETSLISGSVQFETISENNVSKSYLLEPGNTLTFNKNTNAFALEKIQAAYYEYWENGMYSFKDESFESLSSKIKRIFNVEIVFEDPKLKSKTFTGTIGINDNIFIFMEAIRRTAAEPIEYKFNKNIIYVKYKKGQ